MRTRDEILQFGLEYVNKLIHTADPTELSRLRSVDTTFSLTMRLRSFMPWCRTDEEFENENEEYRDRLRCGNSNGPNDEWLRLNDHKYDPDCARGTRIECLWGYCLWSASRMEVLKSERRGESTHVGSTSSQGEQEDVSAEQVILQLADTSI